MNNVNMSIAADEVGLECLYRQQFLDGFAFRGRVDFQLRVLFGWQLEIHSLHAYLIGQAGEGGGLVATGARAAGGKSA